MAELKNTMDACTMFTRCEKCNCIRCSPGNIQLDPLVANNKVTFIKSEYANSRNGDQFYDMLENFADATSPRDAVVEENITLKVSR